jgi:hypothetical protein
MQRVFPLNRRSHPVAYLEHCWALGANAQEFGFSRVSPYYENPEADLFWFFGFDGLSFEAAMRLESANQSTMEAVDEASN